MRLATMLRVTAPLIVPCALLYFCSASALADKPPSAAELQRAQRQAAHALQKRQYTVAAEALNHLEKLARDVLAAEKVSPVLKRRARAALSYVERMRERYAMQLGAGAGTAPSTEASEAKPPRGTVSFVRDIAPLLQRNCVRCHSGNRPRSGFSVETYNRLLQGGDRGDDIVPGKPEESLLVLLLQGKEEPRMPPNRALRPDLVKLFETWIKEGARFDGAPNYSPDTTLTELVPSEEERLRRKLAGLSAAELADYYDRVARRYWQMTVPGQEPVVAESAHFRAYGNVPPGTLRQVLKQAEGALRALQAWFRRKSAELWRGKLTVFVYNSRYYYLEHTRMVERREMPGLVYGHFRPAVELPYAALYVPSETEQVDAVVAVAQAIADAYMMRAFEGCPAWLRGAVALKLAARLARGSHYVLSLQSLAAEELPVSPQDVRTLLTGGMEYLRARLVGYLLLEALGRGRSSRELRSLVELVTQQDRLRRMLEGRSGEALLARFAAAINAAAANTRR